MKTFIYLLFIGFLISGCDNSSAPSLRALNQKCAQGQILGQYLIRQNNGRLTKIFASTKDDLFKQLDRLQDKNIQALDYNFQHRIQMSQNSAVQFSPGIGRYGQPLLGIPDLWKDNLFGQNISIAVIDTGLDLNHPLVAPKLLLNSQEQGNDEDQNGLKNDVRGWNFVDNQPLTKDLQGHGTEVTSVISSAHLDDLQIGIAPEAAILPIAALRPSIDGRDAAGSSEMLIKAVDYAVERGVNLINASWGGPDCSSLLRNSIRRATEKDILFITSAGNDNKNIDVQFEFPSSFSFPRLISVGGIDGAKQKVLSSNFGSRVHFFTPGEDILVLTSGDPDNINLALVTGTSIAAPFLTGSLALLKSAFPQLAPDLLIEALETSAGEDRIPFLPQALNHLAENF